MPTCLIIGASGFLGREVVARLARRYQVIGVAHRNAGATFRAVDIREPDQLRALLRDVRPDVVVHTAAYRDPDFCEQHPEETRRLNVDPVRGMNEILPAEVPLVFISTDYVFDGKNPPYSEDHPRRPLSFYGRSKMEAEDLVLSRPVGLVLRVGLLVGAGPTLAASGFVSQMLQSARAGQPVELDNVIVRFPTWTRDVAHAIEFLLGRRASGVYHMSGRRGGTRYTWTMEIARLLDLPTRHVKPLPGMIQQLAERPLNSQLSTDKIRALGYDGFTDLADVVKNVLAAFD